MGDGEGFSIGRLAAVGHGVMLDSELAFPVLEQGGRSRRGGSSQGPAAAAAEQAEIE